MLNIAITVPTYNESKNVKRLLESIKNATASQTKASIKVYVVDDSSPDGTANVVTEAAQSLNSENFEVRLHKRAKKEGLGKAYIDAFTMLIAQSQFDYILQMDADMSHNPSYIPQFIDKAAENSEFVIASRYIKGGGTPDWSWFRKFLSRWGNRYTRAILGMRISDYTGGFNMYHVDLLKRVDMSGIGATGYGFLIELKYKALKNCRSISEIPIIFDDRTQGKSKIPKSTIIKNLVLVFKLRWLC